MCQPLLTIAPLRGAPSGRRPSASALESHPLPFSRPDPLTSHPAQGTILPGELCVELEMEDWEQLIDEIGRSFKRAAGETAVGWDRETAGE